MTINLEYYQKINNAHGVSNKKDIMINKAKNQIANSFDRNPLAFDVLINKNIHQTVLITTSSKDGTKTIIAKPNETFNQGDIVEWQSLPWLVKDIEPYHDIFTKGTLLECLSSLKWMDEYGEIYETSFALYSDTLSNFGVDEGKIISLPDERRNILIQQNVHTQKITKNRRFIFDERAWKVTGVSRLTSGLVNMVLQEEQIDSAKDNLELRIANYIAPHYEITVDNTHLSLQVGESKKLEITVKNNGIFIIPSPTLSYFSSDESICVINKDGLIKSVAEGSTIVTITYKDVSIKVVVSVKSVASHNYTVEIIDNAATNKFSITKSKSKTFTCSFKDNGVEFVETGKFIVTPITVSPASIAAITSQGNNSCVLRGDNIGSIMLTVSNANGTIVSSQEIKIKSAI